MKKTLLLITILFLLLSAPGVSSAQSFSGHSSVDPLGGASPGLANGGFHFHINPLEDHPAFESLERDTYRYEALHGYEHSRGEELRRLDRFKDIRNPKNLPGSSPSVDSFFGVEVFKPLN